MRRVSITVAGALAMLLCAGVFANAQTNAQVSRDAYRTAYRNWRQADPDLERNAGAGGPLLAQRAESLAELARNYGVERGAFLQALVDTTQRGFAWLESPPAEPPAGPSNDPGKPAAARVTAEMTEVKRTIDTYANDPDPGLQRVRMMLERQNLALAELNNAMVERQHMADAAQAAAAAARIAQANAFDREREVIAGLKQAVGESDREKTAWAEYYRLLADAARRPVDSPADGPAAPVTPPPSALVTLPPPVSTPAATPASPPPIQTAPQIAATPTPPAPEPPSTTPPRPSVITPVPLIRYTGSWTFPQADGQFHGPQPEFVDLVVLEENGRASGTLFARFKLPPGSTGDPIVRFDFSGNFSNTRNQVFELQTSDGAKGTFELIPGPAFNLLEINFLIDPRPGKIRQANAVLLKK